MIDNRRRAKCITCGKATSVTVVADGFDDAPESFTATIECDGHCKKTYLKFSADEMHKQFRLPLSGWTTTRY